MVRPTLARSLTTALALCWGLACGSDDTGADANASGAPTASNGKPAPSSSASTSPTATPPPATQEGLAGLWEVQGRDDRGEYVGEIELRPENAGPAGAFSFIRHVRYPNVKVEDGRVLHWLFRGKLTQSGDKVSVSASLKRLDFIVKRGALTRTPADVPIELTGSLAVATAQGQISGTIAGTDIALTDTWRAKKPLPSTPIFEDKRAVVAAHDPPTSSDKAARFAAYSGYHGLAIIKPYVNRPEFQAAIHGHVVDPTDFDFYRANPDALRVIQKPIDEISLGETRARADAYRYTLAKKAERFDADVETRFVDPDVGMIPEGGAPGASFSAQVVSGDGSLWTGMYLAGQVYRHQVTGSAKAKENVLRSLGALLTLQEITGDWTKFARTLRKATGNPQPPWHAGTGAFSHLEWLEGGNNDMIKGLFYGLMTSWELLCEGGKTGYESYCARIRTNAKHLADDVQLGGSNALGSQTTNKLPAAWLAAVTADSVSDSLSYRATAEGYWTAAKAILAATPSSTFQGQADGSGVHLQSVGDLAEIFMAKRVNLGNSATAAYKTLVDASYANLQRYRLPEWDLLAAAEGSDAGNAAKVAPIVENARTRLREVMVPKVSYAIDWTINPEFCMSPYPIQPWKGDWMQYPTSDRTGGLNSAPLFATRNDVLMWKVNNAYRASEPWETPGSDFLHLYWFARKYGLLSATE